MWEYKVGNNANIANFKCLRKTRMTKRGYIMVITNLTNDVTIIFPADKSRCEATGQKLQSTSFNIFGEAWLRSFTNTFLWLSAVYTKGARGGSRIPHRRGRQPSRRGPPAYKFARFSEKLHEIEKIWIREGGAGDTPLRSATEGMTVIGLFFLKKGHHAF